VDVFKVLVVHGPNLNILGKREPEVYGTLTLDEINDQLQKLAKGNGTKLRIVQSNSEGALIDAIQDALQWADGIVINPGAYTHYSYAIRDALAAVRLPAIEVHLSNIYSREGFRNHSVISSVASGCIAGLGMRSYTCGLLALIGILNDREKQ
jgi:3-dehydroquinate dehydratase II